MGSRRQCEAWQPGMVRGLSHLSRPGDQGVKRDPGPGTVCKAKVARRKSVPPRTLPLPPPQPSARPSPHLGWHRQVLRRRLQLQHRVHLPVGQRRRGVGSPVPESQLLPSIPLRRRLGQQQRRLSHRRRPRGSQQQQGGGDPDRQARATSGRAGASSKAQVAERSGAGRDNPTPEALGGTAGRTDVALKGVKVLPVTVSRSEPWIQTLTEIVVPPPEVSIPISITLLFPAVYDNCTK